jgi:glucosamine 6-phosphate synthetase-like amidotransferase/phosphosugar isomerase protein
MHAGIVGKYVIEELAKTPVVVDIASESVIEILLLQKMTLLL